MGDVALEHRMTKTWFRGAAVAGLVAALGSGSATAAPESLRSADLDRVVAGSVADIDQLHQALIERVFLPRLLALQQQLAAADSPLAVDIEALLELLEYQLAPAAPGVEVAAARTAGAAPGPAVRSLLLRGPDATVNIFGVTEGGQPVIDISINETADGASAAVSIEFAADQPASIRVGGASATATSGN
jgi:hypothetical protein